jgi:hypothetical protein
MKVRAVSSAVTLNTCAIVPRVWWLNCMPKDHALDSAECTLLTNERARRTSQRCSGRAYHFPVRIALPRTFLDRLVDVSPRLRLRCSNASAAESPWDPRARLGRLSFEQPIGSQSARIGATCYGERLWRSVALFKNTSSSLLDATCPAECRLALRIVAGASVERSDGPGQ